MANYDRRILVPYLQDVCSAEMLCSKLCKEIEVCQNEINALNWKINQKIVDPLYPDWSDYKSDEHANNFVYVFFFVILPILIGIWVFQAVGAESLGFLVIVALVVVFLGGPGIMGIFETRAWENKNYEAAVDRYKEVKEQNQKLREQIPFWKDQISKKQNYIFVLKNRLLAAQKLRNNVYSVNIIPSRYRNIHVAYYLYDFFNSSRETDLEKTIQTMLLDEIIQRLDRIIAQNEEIMINQRMQLAMQEKQNKMMAEHHREEMKSIARMEQNQQLQLDYQDMIAKNQMVTNFFLEADYLRKYH